MFNKTVSGSNLRKSLISTPLFAVPRFSEVFSTGTLADVLRLRATLREQMAVRNCLTETVETALEQREN